MRICSEKCIVQTAQKIVQVLMKLLTWTLGAIKRGKHEMDEAAAGVTQPTVYSQLFNK
jgi:hypothetical protein